MIGAEVALELGRMTDGDGTVMIGPDAALELGRMTDGVGTVLAGGVSGVVEPEGRVRMIDLELLMISGRTGVTDGCGSDVTVGEGSIIGLDLELGMTVGAGCALPDPRYRSKAPAR
jgi:hypothetical protein